MSQNIYANRIYAQNPIAVWALDEPTPSSYGIDLSTITSLTDVYGAVATPYKTYSDTDNNLDAYYVSTTSDTAGALTGDFGVPMVYGAGNILNILNGSNNPGLIIPSLGMFHDRGKYRAYTLEFWLKIICSTNTEKRIMGPIGSTDGLYVSGPFLCLKIGNNIKSYQIGEFERPMLISIVYTPTTVELIVNGTKIFAITINVNELNFPTELNEDWIGFYAYDTIPILQVDCIAIYPFLMSESMNNLHFVYGQAVEAPELSIPGYQDVPIVIDYGKSKSSNNYNYPQNGLWEQGIKNNVDSNGPVLKSPQYATPTFINAASTLTPNDIPLTFEQWKQYNKTENESVSGSSFIRMQPIITGTTRTTNNSSLSLNSMALPGNNIGGIFVSAKSDVINDGTNGDTLLAIYDNANKAFRVKVKSNAATFTLDGREIATASITASSDFSIALNIRDLLDEEEDQELSAFFSNLNNLKVYFGGDKTSQTYGGKIYGFGLLSSTDTASSSISTLFSSGTGIYAANSLTILSYAPVYLAKPSEAFNTYDIAVSSKSYWADVIPLSVLCKETETGDYDLTLVQINIDYPAFSDTSGSTVRSYIRLIENTSSADIIAPATTTAPLAARSYITPDADDIPTYRYEFTDHTVLILPEEIQAKDYLLKIEIEINNDDIVRKDFGIRYLKLHSWFFSMYQETPVGTRHGRDFYTGGLGYFQIYKDSTPYFYLSKNSGVRGYFKIPINQSLTQDYYLAGIQFAINFSNVDHGENSHAQILTIIDAESNAYIVGYLPDERKIIVYSTNTDHTVDLVGTKFSVYVDGQDSRTLTENSEKVWHVVSVAFEGTMSFGVSGLEDIVSSVIVASTPFLINNITEIQIPPLSIAQSVNYNAWSSVDGQSDDLLWSEYDQDGDNVLDPGDKTWSQVLVDDNAQLSLEKLKVDVKEYYKNFIGYNRTVVDNFVNNLSFIPNKWKFRKNYRSSKIYRQPL